MESVLYLLLLICYLGTETAMAAPVNNAGEFEQPKKVNEEVDQDQQDAYQQEKQENMQQPRPNRLVAPTLTEDPRCKNDLDNLVNKKGICPKQTLSNNILIIDCLQNNLNEETEHLISNECRHAVWDVKDRLTTDEAVHETVKLQCSDVVNLIPECKEQEDLSGKLLSCLIEHGDAVRDLEPKITGSENIGKFKNCHALLVRLSSIVFGDYRVVEDFIKDCKDSIARFSCGNSLQSAHKESRITSQDETINCLRKHYREIESGKCKHEILRLAELQADDYHLNRALFYACRVDREKFCAKVEAGQGRVYQCLIEHKTAPEMSDQCKAQLVYEQELAQEDYKIDVSFARKCNSDMQQHQCMPDASVHGRVSNEVLMSDIIHCLVSAEREKQGSISNECLGAVHSVARQIMEDFKISPSVVSTCKDEIFKFCNNSLDRDGSTLQCLLMNARKMGRKKNKFSEECMDELKEILEEADVESDFTVDPSLVRYCGSVIEENCKMFTKTGSAVLGCLLEHIGTPALQAQPQCAERVLALYYFISRSWRLDTGLYQSCKNEAVSWCHAKADDKWHKMPKKESTSTRGRLTLSCLYNNAVAAVRARFTGEFESFSKRCVQSISRVMRQRAMDVSLLPEVEDSCMADLATHCSAQTGVGQEMQCLQEKYSELSQVCQEALQKIVRGSETLDINIDAVLHHACLPMMEHFCSRELEEGEHGNPDAAMGVLDCLVKHKHHRKMKEQCQAAIEHHQILQVNDVSVNPRFAAACHQDASKLCSNQKFAHEVLWCLSEIIRNDTLRGASNFRVSQQCRDRVRFEFFTEMDNVKLDPILSRRCGDDIRSFCETRKHETFECLKENWEQLTYPCRGTLFTRVQMEAMQGINMALRTRCERMMSLHCPEVAPHEMIDCLIDSMANDEAFDQDCEMLVKRAQETKAKDVRLNPKLVIHCSVDLVKHCHSSMPNPFGTLLDSNDAGDGKALACLRRAFANESIELRKDCAREVKHFIRQSRTNYKQDLLLARNCKDEIETYCSTVSENQVEQCLRRVFYQSFKELPGHKNVSQKCTYEIARLLDEVRADVQTDSELFTACQGDIAQLCSGPPGRGRVMGCLLSQLNNPRVEVSPKCREMVEMRREMWSHAARPAPPAKLVDVVQIVNTSPLPTAVNVLLVWAVLMFVLIGCFRDRVTKWKQTIFSTHLPIRKT